MYGMWLTVIWCRWELQGRRVSAWKLKTIIIGSWLLAFHGVQASLGFGSCATVQLSLVMAGLALKGFCVAWQLCLRVSIPVYDNAFKAIIFEDQIRCFTPALRKAKVQRHPVEALADRWPLPRCWNDRLVNHVFKRDQYSPSWAYIYI